MDVTLANIVKAYIQTVNQAFSGVDRVLIFGSWARNAQGANSDIDVAVIFDTLDEDERFDRQVQLLLLASKVDSRIEPHPFSRHVFDSDLPFAREIRQTGTLVFYRTDVQDTMPV